MRKNRIFKFVAIVLICLLSCFTLTACFGGGSFSNNGGSSGSSGSGSDIGSGEDDTQPENPYEGIDIIDDFSKFFLGAIGVYDIDGDSKVFYDNYTGGLLSFNELVDRQFNTLATVLYDNLNYVWGNGNFVGTIYDYGNSALSYPNLVSEIVYNNDSLKFGESIGGGYDLIESGNEPILDEEGNPVLDSDGQPTYTPYEYNYSEENNSANKPWKKQITCAGDLIGALKYIYKNPKTVTEESDNLNFGQSTLKTYYSTFNQELSTNNEIEFIGFNREYMWNVIYYLAYSIIGDTRINESATAYTYVFGGGNVEQTITHENYGYFESYKGYQLILSEIVSKAFKLIKNSNNIEVSTNYCFKINSNGVYTDWETTLFPHIDKREYIFYHSINDICDAEESGADDNYEYDSDSFTNYESKVMKTGSLRKLNKIILIPKIIDTDYKKSTFIIDNIILCMTSESADSNVSVKVSANLIGNNESMKLENKQLKFDDGSFDVTLPNGTVVCGEPTNENVTNDGRLILNDSPNPDKYGLFVSIFDNSEEANKYAFGSVSSSQESLILSSFTDAEYTVINTNEKINCGRINVCNNFLGFLSENQPSMLFQNNYMELNFDYFKIDGTHIDNEIPSTYLMQFDIY